MRLARDAFTFYVWCRSPFRLPPLATGLLQQPTALGGCANWGRYFSPAVSSSCQALHEHAGRAHRSDERGAVRSRFSWDTLSVTNATSCGCNKCYFPPQLSECENEGWLVGVPKCETGLTDRGVFPKGFGCQNASASTPPWFPQYSRTWTLAERLQTRFGVGHLLSRPPEIATLASEQAITLNFNLKRHVDRVNRPHWPTPWNRSIPWSERNSTLEPKRYYSPGLHPVQAVRSCPWPSCVMLGCTSLKARSFIRGRTSFLAYAPNKQAEPGDKAGLCQSRSHGGGTSLLEARLSSVSTQRWSRA